MVHIVTHQMDTQSALNALLGLLLNIYFGCLGGIKGHTFVVEYKCQHQVVSLGLQYNMTWFAVGVSVFHDVHHSLFNSKGGVGCCRLVHLEVLADAIHECCQFNYLFYIVA